MFRNFSKFQQPLQEVVSNICKQYGTKARAYVQMADAARANTNTLRNMDPHEETEKHETHIVYTRQTPKTLHFDVECLTEKLQEIFIDKELDHIRKLCKENAIKNISFNCVNENVYRCQLNMPIRKLGFTSSFQRFNDDKDLAVFSVKSESDTALHNSNRGSYNKRALTKQRQRSF